MGRHRRKPLLERGLAVIREFGRWLCLPVTRRSLCSVAAMTDVMPSMVVAAGRGPAATEWALGPSTVVGLQYALSCGRGGHVSVR